MRGRDCQKQNTMPRYLVIFNPARLCAPCVTVDSLWESFVGLILAVVTLVADTGYVPLWNGFVVGMLFGGSLLALHFQDQ